MSEIQAAAGASTRPLERDIHELSQELNSALSAIQSLINQGESLSTESIRYVPSILKQAQETLIESEARLKQAEANLHEAQQIAASGNELQTLLDILPVGIIISHDPQNQVMTINAAGKRMLNLGFPANPSKSAPEGNQLPFKILRGGQEVPPEDLPIQYAMKNKVALRDQELDILHPDGRVDNLLEYASPLYGAQGAVTGCLGVMVDITPRKTVERRLAMQYQIARVLAEATSINNAASQVLKMICETAGWEYGALWRVEPDSQTLTNEGVWHADDINLAEFAETIRYSVLNWDEASLPGHVLHSKQPLWISNLKDFQSQDIIEAVNAGLQSAFILPVVSGERTIAILECLSNRRQIQDHNLTAMLNAVCNQVGIFIERKILEEALTVRANQQQLLAQAGLALSSSLDYEERLRTIVQVIVPEIADWCSIDIIDRDNKMRRAAAAHIDPDKEKLLFELHPTQAVGNDRANSPEVEALLAGQSLLYTELPFSTIEKTITDADQLEIIRKLKPLSAMVVPLVAHNQFLGICTFVQSDSRRQYSSPDLALAEDIVRRTALALDNALLFAESQKLNADLERRVENRTAQLKKAIIELTSQVAERQNAENQVRILNTELEQRIAERTSQLEITNTDLQKEVSEHQLASKALRALLKRTRELYRISQTIGSVRTPNEVLGLLLSSSYLKDASRASIAILSTPWIKDEEPPEYCFILAEWNKGARQPKFNAQHFTLEEYGIALPIRFRKPVVIPDIQSETSLSESVRKRFATLNTHSLIILPLIASGEWFGLLSLHFKTRRMTDMNDLRHVSGLVDETAIVIQNMRLLEAESQARQEAERANDLKLKFLGMISHELRTPLTAIKGFATTLLADDVVWPADKQRDFLETINSESDKLHDLIEQLLDLSRMEAGTLRILPEKVRLSHVVDSALAQLQAITTEHEMIMEIPPHLPPVVCDAQRIAQVLTNLINNAAKYSPPQTKITISAHRSDNMIQVDVSDLGPGIPPKDHLRVFEAFRQLENGTDNRAKGAGLGLAICKGLVEAHNGKIWIQDHRGPGTIISFTLPVSGEIKKSTK